MRLVKIKKSSSFNVYSFYKQVLLKYTIEDEQRGSGSVSHSQTIRFLGGSCVSGVESQGGFPAHPPTNCWALPALKVLLIAMCIMRMAEESWAPLPPVVTTRVMWSAEIQSQRTLNVSILENVVTSNYRMNATSNAKLSTRVNVSDCSPAHKFMSIIAMKDCRWFRASVGLSGLTAFSFEAFMQLHFLGAPRWPINRRQVSPRFCTAGAGWAFSSGEYTPTARNEELWEIKLQSSYT